jgi:metal-dependent amidase/aminoacylase/carboxypeptidase family protein
MRLARSVFLLWLLAAAAGCKNKSDEPDLAALKAQQDLITRRDALLAARTKLQTERETIETQIKDTQAKGGDTADLVKRKAELDSQIETQTTDLLNMVNSRLDAIKLSGDKTANVAAREAEIANREKALADREARVADREKQLVARDSELAQRWKDSCNTGGTPVIIQQAAPKPGGNYTKKDVTDLIGRAKSTMAKKGLIGADLPGPAQSLENETAKALNDNDMSKAYFAAAQLVGTVDSIVINRAFIQSKTGCRSR